MSLLKVGNTGNHDSLKLPFSYLLYRSKSRADARIKDT
jgi:hypothetical protein